MLQFAMAYGTTSPFLMASPKLSRLAAFSATLLWLVLAGIIAVASYVLALWSFTKACPPHCVMAPYVYASGLLIATCLSVGAAAVALPRRLLLSVLPYASAAVVTLQVGVVVHTGAGAASSFDIYYLIAIVTGGVGGTRLTEQALA